jgi:hypothetical protein
MNKQTAALISLYAGRMLTADTAHATAYEDIAGHNGVVTLPTTSSRRIR